MPWQFKMLHFMLRVSLYQEQERAGAAVLNDLLCCRLCLDGLIRRRMFDGSPASLIFHPYRARPAAVYTYIPAAKLRCLPLLPHLPSTVQNQELSHNVSTHLKSQFYSHPHLCMLAYSIPHTRVYRSSLLISYYLRELISTRN